MWLWGILTSLTLVLAAQDEQDLLFQPMTAPLPPSTTPPSHIEDTPCFNVKTEGCPATTERCRCRYVQDNSVVCCNIVGSAELTASLKCAEDHEARANNKTSRDVHRLHIRNATLENYENLGYLHLRALSITEGQVNNMTNVVLTDLTCLNLTANNIPDMGENILTHLRKLKILDLSRNNLTRLPNLMSNLTLDISGNNGLLCVTLEQFISENPFVKFVNSEKTFCMASDKWWFDSKNQVPLSQILMLRNIKKNCTSGCTCTTHRLSIVPGKAVSHALSVNCSALGLTKLPEYLPANTVVLNVSFNNITNLDALSEDPQYQDIQEFYGDSNQISSILALEGSKFIDNFQTLSLRNNNIKSLPTYILSNTFDRNDLVRRVNLGGNRLTCNCSVAQVVKLWLLSNKKNVPDHDQLLCDTPGETLMLQRVIDLDQNKVCLFPRDWTDYIYFIIAAEVSLLFLLVGKVSYDYWVFKTAGYLPWPASKMPKLPCDWVFE